MKRLFLISALLFSFNGWADDEMDLFSAQVCVAGAELVETLKLEVEALESINPEVDIEIYERLSEARNKLTIESSRLEYCKAKAGAERTIITEAQRAKVTIIIIVLLIVLVGLGYFLRSKFLDNKINQETHKNQDKSKEKITNDNPTFLQYLADYYSSIVSVLAVLTALIGVVIALVAMFTEEVLMGFVILLGTPLVVILVYGFVAIILEIHRHLKSIDNKLSGEGDSKDG